MDAGEGVYKIEEALMVAEEHRLQTTWLECKAKARRSRRVTTVSYGNRTGTWTSSSNPFAQQMEQHPLAIPSRDSFWNWSNTKRIQLIIQESGQQGGKWESVTHKLLYYLILESQTFGGEVLEMFWTRLGNCNRKLEENSKSRT